jgi:hypothetical protein
LWDEEEYFKAHPEIKKLKMSSKKLEKLHYRYENYCSTP